MGGMIAQVLAARNPQRVLSLTSIMSSSGNPSPRDRTRQAQALRAILNRPRTSVTWRNWPSIWSRCSA